MQCNVDYQLSSDSTACSEIVEQNQTTDNNQTTNNNQTIDDQTIDSNQTTDPSNSDYKLLFSSRVCAFINQILILIVIVITSVGSTMKSSSKQPILALINQYQLLLLLPLLGTYIEDDFQSFVTEFQYMSFDLKFIDNVFYWPYIDSTVSRIDYEQPEYIFKMNGIESGSFLCNHYTFFKLIITIAILDTVLSLIRCLIPKKRGRKR